jgi:ribonuclease-3
MRIYRDRIETLPEPQALKDAKTRLQEWLQARSLPLPTYSVDAVTGKEHEKSFRVVCSLEDGSRSSVGSGRSRRRAEQAAAANLLAELLGE